MLGLWTFILWKVNRYPIFSEHVTANYSLVDEFPGQQQTVHYRPDYGRDEFLPIHDHAPLTLEKSNVLCLGPTGVGKTLMIRLAATNVKFHI